VPTLREESSAAVASPNDELVPPPSAAVEPLPGSSPATSEQPATQQRPRKERATPQPVELEPTRSNTSYDNAHRLHFLVHDYAAALAAWDEYLNELPTPVLHVEAHYNRAICLLRLERYEDAKRALAPFAAGIYGKYRQRDAAALMRAIQAKHDP
jgi:TolA-binding protein